MVLDGKTGGVVIARHGISSCNVLTRGLGDYRWAASARCWRRCWGAAAAARTLDRHSDAFIGDEDAIGSAAIAHAEHDLTEGDRRGQICVWRSGDGQLLRLAETAGKAEARRLNVDRESGVIAVPVAVQLVADLTVLRTVRVQVQLGVQSIFRTDGIFKVLGSPPVFGFASM